LCAERHELDGVDDLGALDLVLGRIDQAVLPEVLETTGTFDGAEAKAPLRIVPGSGTGELKGISGGGELLAPLGSPASLILTYRFE
jgi:Protein of unknown function (DUF3224)